MNTEEKTKVIRIDYEVLEKLKEKAREYDMVFDKWSPNNVLRELLRLSPKEARQRKGTKARPGIQRLHGGRPRTS